MRQFHVTVYASPAPQGSLRAFVVRGKAHLTSDNAKTVPFRHAVTLLARRQMADLGLEEPLAGKHVPVSLILDFHLSRPPSLSKRRVEPAVKPDIDKLSRSVLDSLTGVLYIDDGQVVELQARKHYTTGPEYVEISATIL